MNIVNLRYSIFLCNIYNRIDRKHPESERCLFVFRVIRLFGVIVVLFRIFLFFHLWEIRRKALSIDIVAKKLPRIS